MTNEELKHLLGLAYVRFYVRPSFALNYFGIKTPNETLLRWLETYAKRRQLADDIAFFDAQAAKHPIEQ
jgi:hypothetical protein